MERIRVDRIGLLIVVRGTVTVVVAVMAAGVLAAAGATVFAQPPPDSGGAPLTDRERSMIVPLAMGSTVRVSARPCGTASTGTGFLLDGLLITNDHVVGDAPAVLIDQPSSTVPGVSGPATVLARHPGTDVAIAVPPSGPSLVSADRDPSVGQPVVLAGYGGGRALTTVETRVHLLVGGSAYGSEGPVLLLDHRTVPGFSGGPVLNRFGQVVGLVRAYDRATGLTVAVPISAVLDARRTMSMNRDEDPC